MSRFGQFGIGAGAALQGFNGALDAQAAREERQRRMTLADADGQWQQQRREREQRQWTREDAANADLDASIQAARASMDEDRTQYEKSAPRAPQTMTLDGGAVPGAPATPYQPSRTALLRAAQRQTDELFKRGRMDLGLQHWTKAEALRGQMRVESGQKLMRTLAAGGDITQALRELDDAVDDGLEVASVKQIKGQDGAPAFEIRQRNRLTGAEIAQPNIMTAQDMELRVAKLLADPKETAKHSFQTYMQNLKARQDKENDERQHRLNVERDKANRASAEGVARGNNAATIGAAQIRAATRGKADNGSADRTHTANMLTQERLAAQSDVNTLVDLLANARRPQERTTLQTQLSEARQRVRDIGDKAAGLGSGAGTVTPKAQAQSMPSSKSQLRAGQLYQTARGVARWNGSAFELEAR